MIDKQTMTNFPVFSDNGTNTKPNDAKYSEGFKAAETLPAVWLNYFFNRASGAVTKLNAGVSSMEGELVNILNAAGITPDQASEAQVLEAIRINEVLPRNLTAASTITAKQYNQRVTIAAESTVTTMVAAGILVGAKVVIYNTSAVNQNITLEGDETVYPISAGDKVELEWRGSSWVAECPVKKGDVYTQLGGQKFPQELFPCTKWQNISETYAGDFFRVAGGNSASAIVTPTSDNGDSVNFAYVRQEATYIGNRISSGGLYYYR